VCNLCSITTNQDAIASLFRVLNQYVGKLPPMPGGVSGLPGARDPKQRGRSRDDHDPLGNAASAEVDRPTGGSAAHRRHADAAGEPLPHTVQLVRRMRAVWFALDEDRTLANFAGIWKTFNGDRGTKSKLVPGPHLIYGFLTTGQRPSSSRSTRRPCR
jgi:hypothetical protein